MDTATTTIVMQPATPATPELPPTPYVVVRDTREQRPYEFSQPLAWTPKKHFRVQTTIGCLQSGDYSLLGHETQIAVERKSLCDLYSTFGQSRPRFHRELERLAAMPFAAVVIEAEWSTILGAPPVRSRLLPKTVLLSVVAWQQRFPAVHWWAMPGRDAAEATVIRILDRWWRERNA